MYRSNVVFVTFQMQNAPPTEKETPVPGAIPRNLRQNNVNSRADTRKQPLQESSALPHTVNYC